MIELACKKDLSEIWHIFEAAKKQMLVDNIKQWTPTYPDKRQVYHDIMTKKCFKLIVDEEIVSVASLFIDQNMGWVKRIATKPEYSHQGFASILYEYIEQEVITKHIKKIYGATNHSNQKMQIFFLKHGFVKEAAYEEPLRKAYGQFYIFCKKLE